MTVKSDQQKKFLRPKDVIEQYGISRSTLYVYVKNKKIPEPKRFSSRLIGWSPDVIEAAFRT